MSIRRVTMHQSAQRLAHACERQARTIVELPSVSGVGPAAGRAETARPRTRRAPAKRKTKRR